MHLSSQPQSVRSLPFAHKQQIIWDSGNGYEIGYFHGLGNQTDTWLVDICSGSNRGLVSFSKREIRAYSKSLAERLSIHYGVRIKTF